MHVYGFHSTVFYNHSFFYLFKILIYDLIYTRTYAVSIHLIKIERSGPFESKIDESAVAKIIKQICRTICNINMNKKPGLCSSETLYE